MTTRLNLRDLRRLRSLTQAELADAAGVARATVNRLEMGRARSVDLAALSRLATALDVHPAMLFLAPVTSSNTERSERPA